MPDPRNLRWLQVAIRASEFQVLSAASDLVPVARRADDAQREHQASQHAMDQAQLLWRSRLAGEVFHADQDRQFRQFGNQLAQTGRLHAEAHEMAQHQLLREQAALRQGVAQKNGLKAALKQAHREQQDAQGRQSQRDADETWSARHLPKEAGL